MAGSPEKCPVDHSHIPEQTCPVDHSTSSAWANILPHGHPSISHDSQPSLSREREVSSIPRSDEGRWVYPSEAQFFAAMARKNHDPQASDMKTVVPIHNAVNERAWAEVMKWEAGRGGERCGGIKLVTFKGRPNQMSPKARLMSLVGYTPPFDRHDWIVDRCGTRIRYVIDFYTGRGTGQMANKPSFYLDVRPALDNFEGLKMRLESMWQNLSGSLASSTPPPSTSQPTKPHSQ